MGPVQRRQDRHPGPGAIQPPPNHRQSMKTPTIEPHAQRYTSHLALLTCLALAVDGQAALVSRFGRLESVNLSTNLTPGYVLTQRTNSSGARYWTNQPPGTVGTVTSVGLSAPSEFSVSGSPVT